MKPKTLLSEFLILLLVADLFYQGIYKIAYWGNFALWLHHAPLIESLYTPLTYLIPLWQIGLSLSLLFPSKRTKALSMIMGSSLAYILWIACAHAFSKRIFFPFHGVTKHSTWMEQMVISLAVLWIAFFAKVLSEKSEAKPVIRSNRNRLHFEGKI